MESAGPSSPPHFAQPYSHLDESMHSWRKRVGFTSDSSPPDDRPSSSRIPEDALETGSAGQNTPLKLRTDVSHEELSEQIHKALGQPYVPKPRPAIRKTDRNPPQFHLGDDIEEDTTKRL